jgi:tol-pal system protein YbgF
MTRKQGDPMSKKSVFGRPLGATPRRARRVALVAIALVAVLATACVTPAEFRKVSNRVTDLERARGRGGDAERGRVADLASELEALHRSIEALNGRVEVVEHRVQQALEEARAARRDANVAPGGAPVPDGDDVPGAGSANAEELRDYRAAVAEWRSGNASGCVDQFTKFLQTYPASEYADDATYWLADCYFKQGNFSAAVLRFDDVARQYPSGNKAADALYRQGEALLRMGHGKAAGNAFEKVLRDYPNSERAPEAKRQLDLLGAG